MKQEERNEIIMKFKRYNELEQVYTSLDKLLEDFIGLTKNEFGNAIHQGKNEVDELEKVRHIIDELFMMMSKSIEYEIKDIVNKE